MGRHKEISEDEKSAIEADKTIKELNGGVEFSVFDKELLSKEQIEQLQLFIIDYRSGKLPVVNLIQHWSSLPSKLACGRFPEITEFLK